MNSVQQILDAAQHLPPTERVQLIYALWDSVSSDDWAPPNGEWISESQRRSAAIDAGTMKTSPWEQVRERARKKAGLDE
jgi:putative addiction module component (TIGR02574 family)